MAAQDVRLTDHGQKFVDSVVMRGEHDSASEVVDVALRQYEHAKRAHDAMTSAFRDSAGVGLDDLDNGRYTVVARADLAGFVAGLSSRAAEGSSSV